MHICLSLFKKKFQVIIFSAEVIVSLPYLCESSTYTFKLFCSGHKLVLEVSTGPDYGGELDVTE